MRPLTILLVFSLTVFVTTADARDPYLRQEAIDVDHYVFQIEFNDSNDVISGVAQIRIRFRKPVQSFFLDLAGPTPDRTGMTVRSVVAGEQLLPFVQSGEQLTITLRAVPASGQLFTVTVRYDGIPRDGLVISKSKFGDRTFFADHWPDRGHQWLPCIDHPSDKASVEWMVVAPAHYQVIATGRRLEEKMLQESKKLTHYSETAPVAVKVMAVGVARFSIQEAVVDSTAQSIWVFPQNAREGFHDFQSGMPVFHYFQEQIGPFAYEKLAHVQSKTRWGGLENAGNIFYNENLVTGSNPLDHLIAHETAHQWFGDAVTEEDWHHVWLSEGFANYFANLYYEHAFGQARFKEEMAKERERVIQYSHTNPNPLVDTTIQNINKVLNTNAYQKGCWVLHMLRRDVGDEAFWTGIRSYYARYKNSNVLTRHFQQEMEKAAKRDLSEFFKQWAYRGGHPRLAVTWMPRKSNTVRIRVNQLQNLPFRFPLVLRFQLADGSHWDQQLNVDKEEAEYILQPPGRVVSIMPDPECNLLFEGSVKAK